MEQRDVEISDWLSEGQPHWDDDPTINMWMIWVSSICGSPGETVLACFKSFRSLYATNLQSTLFESLTVIFSSLSEAGG